MSTAALSISADAIRHNYKLLKALCANQDVGAVVKSNAYGLGISFVVPVLESAGCRYFFVNSLEEGKQVRSYAQAPIYVFNGLMPGEKKEEYDSSRLTPVFSTYEALEQYPEEKQIAVRLDTGMNMAGLNVSERKRLIEALSGRDVEFLMSHLACSETPADEMNVLQLNMFQEVSALFPKAKKSLSASYGIALGQEYLFDVVRPGASLYGASVLKGGMTAARLSARVGWIEQYEAGSSIGYNHSAVLSRPSVIATLLIGTSDGIVHKQGCFVVFKDKLLPVIGHPTSNYLAVDVTNVGHEIKVGDNVDLFNEKYTPDQLALDAGMSIGADVLIKLRENFPRCLI